jgi:sulfur carrier protein
LEITLNGEKYQSVKDPLTVKELLGCLGISPGRVAVEVNVGIVKKCDYETHTLNEGDTVEIVNFVGGG